MYASRMINGFLYGLDISPYGIVEKGTLFIGYNYHP